MAASGGMDPATWQVVKPLFEQALDLPPGQQEKFLQEIAAAKPAAARCVRAMLAAHGGSAAWLDRSLPERILALPEPREAPGPTPGSLAAGRYRLVRELGRGGNGCVWLAHDESVLQRAVAVKILKTGALGESFDTELQALARLDHPCIATPMDSGRLPDGRRFLVLGYVSGPSLRELLAHGPLEPTRACRLLLEIAAALDSAHKGGVWHLDLKPENVMIREAGEPGEQAVVVDFGISRLAGPAAAGATPAASLAYCAPEQLEGRPCAASDQYSLARMAVEMITGHKPGPLEPAGALLARCGALRRSVARIFRRALDFRPEARYPSLTGFAVDLDLALDPTRAAAWRTRYIAAALCFLLAGVIAVYVSANRERERGMVRRELASASAQVSMVASLMRTGRLDHAVLSQTLQGAIHRLNNLAASGRIDPDILLGLFEARMQYGAMYSHPSLPHFGSVETAIASFEQAIETLEHLYVRRRKDRVYAANLSRARNALASSLIEAGDDHRAAGLCRESLAGIAHAEAAGWAPEHARKARAGALLTLSEVHFRRSEWERCENLRSEAVRLLRLAPAPAGELAAALAARAGLFSETGRFQQALADYTESNALMASLQASPGDLSAQVLAARIQLEHGRLLLKAGRLLEAERLLQQAASAHRSLAADSPQLVSIQRSLALSLCWLASAQAKLRREPRAWRALFIEADQIAAASLSRDPRNAKASEELSLIRRQAASHGLPLGPES